MKVLVAGGGPAGSRLAEKLSRNGIEVVLVEKLKSPNQNTFSSAAIPIRSLEDLDIPIESIASTWNEWEIVDPIGNNHVWTSLNDLGLILDFGKFRESLWSKAQSVGVELLLGWSVKAVSSYKDFAKVQLIGPNGEKSQREVTWVFDATGHSRYLIGHNGLPVSLDNDQFHKGQGIEWIIQADPQTQKRSGGRLTFFLGSKWVPYGYGWIFPMSNNQFKVGVCSLPPSSAKEFSLSSYLRKIIEVQELSSCQIVDRHGGVVNSSIKRSEAHSKGRIIGIGDAVSTANLLGGEGIRHALTSAEVLAPLVIEASKGAFHSQLVNEMLIFKYRKILHRSLGWRWTVANKLGQKTWSGLSGRKADLRLISLINGLSKYSSAEGLSALLFDYRFERYGLRFLPYVFGLLGGKRN